MHQLDDQGDSQSDDHNDQERLPSFESIKTSRKFVSNVDGEYTDWTPREAFRDLIQNWRDAIIESNSLAPKDFCITREANGEANGEAVPPKGDTEIVYKAFRRHAKDNGECLGFVRYKGRKGLGTVEITNLRAALQTRQLRIGTTSKKQSEEQAGTHGEGLKIAAITFMRNYPNHRLFGRSTGFNLSFNFDMDGSYCVRVSRIKHAPVPTKSTIPTPAVNANRDVQFIIGECWEGRNEFGEQLKRSAVQQNEFKSWTTVALFLTEVEGGDASIVSTVHGDLLLSADQRGKLYLKGLFVYESTQSHSASITICPLGFGYNFASGKTDRDRRTFVNDELEAICKILSEALMIRPDQVGKVCELLNSAEIRYGEGECRVRSWPSRTALLFKQHLLEGEFASRWLYSSREMQKNPGLLRVIKGMGRQPFQLSSKLWAILFHHSLVHTVEEEAQRCYKNAPAVPLPDTNFATSVNGLLQACIRACPQTKAMRVEFVDPGHVHLNLFVSEQKALVRIHKRWLSMESAVAKLGLIGNVAEARAAVFVAKKLFFDTVRSVPIENFLQEDSSELPDDRVEQQLQRAEQRLENYQMAQVSIIDARHDGHLGLTVEWAVNDGQQEQEDIANIEIQCHRVSHCSHLRDQPLVAADVDARYMVCLTQDLGEPPCRVHRTHLHRGKLCVRGLEEGEEYFFALVTSADPDSLVRVSEAKRVTAQSGGPSNHSPPGRNNRDDTFSLGTQIEAQDLLEQALASGRWYNAENSHGVRAVIGFAKGEKSHPAESRKRTRTN